jgi:type IV secretion system protein VirB11
MSAILPDGSRVQVVAPPATRAHLALAIRKHVARNLSLGDFREAGAFDRSLVGGLNHSRTVPDSVIRLLNHGDIAAALSEAVQRRLNVVVAGGTSSGKTTFLNALLREIPLGERLILIEDTPEIQLDHENHVGLIAVRGALGETQVTASDLLAASLRMRPDRIILGELRGSEALAFLRAINSGHPGSMTTLHADSPESALEQIVLLALEAGTQLTRDDVRHYVRHTVDLFVQLSRQGGVRGVERLVARGFDDSPKTRT